MTSELSSEITMRTLLTKHVKFQIIYNPYSKGYQLICYDPMRYYELTPQQYDECVLYILTNQTRLTILPTLTWVGFKVQRHE